MTPPRIRASDADRQRSVDILARHFTEGRLDSSEYDERVRRAYACVYVDELAPLFTDLPPEAVRVESYDEAWRRGYGPPDRRVFSGLPQSRAPLGRALQVLPLALLAIVMLVLVAESRGLLLPLPLILIGWFGLNAARRGNGGRGPHL